MTSDTRIVLAGSLFGVRPLRIPIAEHLVGSIYKSLFFSATAAGPRLGDLWRLSSCVREEI